MIHAFNLLFLEQENSGRGFDSHIVVNVVFAMKNGLDFFKRMKAKYLDEITRSRRRAKDGLIKNGVKKIETWACLKEQPANGATQEQVIKLIVLEF